MYFSTKNIPELDGLSVRQRQEVIHLAVANLPASKKITLNVVKIACLTPIFLLLANIESWWLLFETYREHEVPEMVQIRGP